jgi:hypothetical protein
MVPDQLSANLKTQKMKSKTPKWKQNVIRKIRRQLRDSGWYGWCCYFSDQQAKWVFHFGFKY